jgi:hypothetical protein
MKTLKFILGIIPISIALFCIYLCAFIFDEDKYNMLGIAIWQIFLEEFE